MSHGEDNPTKSPQGAVCLTVEVLLSHSQGTSLCIASPGKHASLCRVPHELVPGALSPKGACLPHWGGYFYVTLTGYLALYRFTG